MLNMLNMLKVCRCGDASACGVAIMSSVSLGHAWPGTRNQTPKLDKINDILPLLLEAHAHKN